MEAQKQKVGRPRGKGPFGALRARLGQMRVGETIVVTPDDLTEAAKPNPGPFVGSVANFAAHDIGGAKFSRISANGSVFVRRVA